MSKFQIIIIAVCVIAGLAAVLMFSGIIPGFKGGKNTGISKKEPEVSMWGIFPGEKIAALFPENVKYSAKEPLNYEKELINALASGAGPDIWIMSQDMVLKDKNKAYNIPFESFSERDYKDKFLDSSELFIDRENKGIVGFPFAIDPIVLYWNVDLFSSAGIARPPKDWYDFLKDVQAMTKKDSAGNIIQAGASFGEFNNVKNAKEIISMLILQAGNPIIKSDTLDIVFDEKGDALLAPAENAVRFFNEFSNPNKTSYTWNKALPDSNTMFAGGSLAMYLGYASEIKDIRQKNPHLNFDIAEAPQVKDGKIKATFGTVYGLAVSKSSPNIPTALSAVSKLTDINLNKSFSEALGLGSARREVLAGGSGDSLLSVVYKSSIMTRSWLEPDPQAVSEIFKNMIESTTAGKARISEAVYKAGQQLEQLLK